MSHNVFIGIVLISLAIVAHRQYKAEGSKGLFISPHAFIGVLMVYSLLAIVGLFAPPVATALGVAVLVGVSMNLFGSPTASQVEQAKALGVHLNPQGATN